MFTTITVTGTYGGSAAGTVGFVLTNTMFQPGGLTEAPIQQQATLSGSAFSLALPATNDPTTTPPGTAYLVEERINGGYNHYYAIVPYDAVSGTADITDLVRVLPTPYPNKNMLLAASLNQPGGPVGLDSLGNLRLAQMTYETARATAAESALSAIIAGLSATAWLAATAYPAEKIVSNGVGLWEAPTGGVPARSTFTSSDWIHLADIALPVGTTSGTVAAGNDSRITGSSQKAANLSDLADIPTARATLIPNGTMVPTSLTVVGAPTTGTHVLNEVFCDAHGITWKCTAGGTPGTWVQAVDSFGAASGAQAAAIAAAATDATTKANNAAAAAEAASDPVGTATAAVAAAQLNRTAVKTANYAMAAFDLVPTDISGGSVTHTLPNAPADKTVCHVKLTAVGGTNTCAVATAGADVYDRVGGGVSTSLSLLGHGKLFIYQASTKVWTILADDLPLPQLDARYDASGAALSIRNSTDDGYDIWILAGQSNMLGVDPAFNIVTTDPVHPRVYEWPSSGANVGNVIQASDPLLHQLSGGQLGPGMPFARWMADLATPTNRRILVCPCAQSTTGFVHSYDNLHLWAVGTSPTANNLYLFAVAQAQAALAAVSLAGGTSRVAGVLWDQGEMDSLLLADANAYAANLDALIAGFRSVFGATLPFIIISMEPAYVVDNVATGSAIVNAAHIDTPRRNVLTAFVYGPAGMSLQGGAFGTDTHYTAAGARINGQRAAEALVRSKLNVLGTAPVVPTGLALAQSGANLIVSWKQVMGRATDYTVQYRITGAGSWTTATRTSPNIDVTCSIPITDGTSYDVQVSSTNEQGTSAYCASVTLLTVTIPGQVVGLATGTPSGASMPLTWTATAGAVTYLVQYKAHSSGTWLTFGSVATNAATVIGLQPSTSYDFQVQAVNPAGSGTFSTTVTTSTSNINPPITDIGVSAARAYGVRLLVAGYAGNCMRVRRSSDNTTLDIGFVSGYLDTASLLTFVGAGNGFVNIWYDQSGNARDLTQATAANQPQIVAAGVVNVANGKATLIFNGTSQYFVDSSPGMYAAGSASVLQVLEPLNNSAGWVVNESRSSTTNAKYTTLGQNVGQPFMTLTTDAGTNVLNSTATNKINTMLNQVSFNDTGTVAQQWINGTTASTGAVAYTRAATTLDRFVVGAQINNTGAATGWANVTISELLVFYGALTAINRQAGEANQVQYFAT